MTPYYSENNITIYNGDCCELLPEIQADVIVTDPPYGVGKAEWDVAFPTDWIAQTAIHRMLVMTGNTALIKAGIAFGDSYRDCIVMHATNGMTKSKVAFGNWFPVLAIGDWKWEGRPNYIKFVVDTTEKIDHPSPKPLDAMLRLLNWYTADDWTIADAFMGSGTTLVAARKMGLRAIGIEIEEKYCEVAANRLSQTVMDFTQAEVEEIQSEQLDIDYNTVHVEIESKDSVVQTHTAVVANSKQRYTQQSFVWS